MGSTLVAAIANEVERNYCGRDDCAHTPIQRHSFHAPHPFYLSNGIITHAMKRREFLAASGLAAAQTAKKPNFVFIFSDDHHFQCLGAAGNPYIATPNLDKLASRGVLFTHGMISTPQCCPSRGIMLSGLETYQSGLLSNGATSFKPGIGPTVVEQMRRGGYETNLVGKWHVTPTPGQCGFEKAPLWLRGGSSKYIDPLLRTGLDGKDTVVRGHITELFTNAAVDVIRGAREPYLLWLTYNAPHSPWTALDEFRPKNPQAPPSHPKDAKPFDWSTYYAVISHLDHHVGRVVNAIEKAGQWENTLIFFVGDNGFLCGTKGLGGKVYPWEESVRVPFLAAGGMVKPRGKDATPVASIDVPATWLDYAGIKPAYKLSGASLRPELSGGGSKHEHAFSTWADGRVEALAVKRAVEPYRLVRTRFYKYILWESRKDALYEPDKDLGETRNLAENPIALHKQVHAEMRGALGERMKATGDPALAWLG